MKLLKKDIASVLLDETTLTEQLRAYRWWNRLINKKLGKLLNVDDFTVLAWENETRVPKNNHLK